MPGRALMWMKAREDKNGGHKTAAIEDLSEHEEQIAAGVLEFEPGTNVVTLVLGKEKGGFVKGIGYGLTASKYWGVRGVKRSSKERIAQLEYEVGKRDEEVDKLSALLESTNALLASRDAERLSLEARLKQIEEGLFLQSSASQVHLVPNPVGSNQSTSAVGQNKVLARANYVGNILNSGDVQQKSTPHLDRVPNPVGSNQSTSAVGQIKIPARAKSMDKNVDRTVVAPQSETLVRARRSRKRNGGVSMDAATLAPETTSSLESQGHETKVYDCSLGGTSRNNTVARGRVHWSTDPQKLHGKAIPKGCYKVCVDTAIKNNAFIPHQLGDIKTVEDALGTFVSWPGELIVCDQELPPLPSRKKPDKAAKRPRVKYTTIEKLNKQKTRNNVKKTDIYCI